jgi:hypothetical protein
MRASAAQFSAGVVKFPAGFMTYQNKRNLGGIFSLAIFFSIVTGALPAHAVTPASWHTADWIDGENERTTQPWQQQLGIDRVRISCKVSIRNTPKKCVDFIAASTAAAISSYFIYALVNDTNTLLSDATQYSALTAGVPSIKEVGFDDFFGSYINWYNTMADAPQFLGQFIDNLKGTNPELKFGITLYENELDPVRNPYISAARMPAAIKAKFDYIHLFLHYRKNASKVAQYVSQTRAWFPNAAVIAGVYSYDRIDYTFPCAQNDPLNTHCTQSEEISLFQEALDAQVRLFKQGTVIGLEFFPGYFGNENLLYGPGPGSDNLACTDLARCVQTTTIMRDSILAARSVFNAPPIGVLPGSALNPRAYPNPWRSRDGGPGITFDRLVDGSIVKIYAVTGEEIKTLPRTDDFVVWDLTDKSGGKAASGLYIYHVASGDGQKASGKVAVIR